MYEVTIENGGVTKVLHEVNVNSLRRLSAGKLAEEVSAIPSLSFTIPVSNPCYADELHDRKTIVTLTNTRTHETEFEGSLLTHSESMSASGILSKKAVAEGFLGYLCDSIQPYHHYENSTITEFLTALLDNHNAQQDDDSKKIYLGSCDFSGDNTNSKTTAYRNTLEEIKVNLISRVGGEIRVRRVEGRLVLDFLHQYGVQCSTRIELANNMRSLSVSSDSTHIVTRLIPLGAQLDPGESAERLDIRSVNSGSMYIDDTAAIAKYGVIVGTVVFDDITVAANLKSAGQQYLANNNRIKKSYSGQVLDLSTIDATQQSIRAGNTYRFVNTFLGLDEDLRLIKRTVDFVSAPWRPEVEIGDKAERMTDIAVRQNQLIEYELPKQRNEVLSAAKDIATALIDAGINGYVVVNKNEILIMDTDDKTTATNVWRYNLGGWGISHNGYNGPFTMAATLDGGIVADFITAGVLRGIEITNGNGTFHVDSSGNVTASAMSINNGNGVFRVLPNGTVQASAIDITGGSIHISTASETYDVIELTCSNWEHTISPLEFKLENTGEGNTILGQAGLLVFYHNGNQTAYINTETGNIRGERLYGNGDNIGVNDTDNNSHSLGWWVNQLEQRVSALEGN